jgi:hypothetical protein
MLSALMILIIFVEAIINPYRKSEIILGLVFAEYSQIKEILLLAYDIFEIACLYCIDC